MVTRRLFRGTLFVVLVVSAATSVLSVSAAGSPQPSGRLVFATGSDESDRLELAVVNPDGTGSRKITHHPPGGTSPKWTSDGRKILFETHDSFTFTTHFWRMNPNGSRREHLPGGERDAPSPSGTRVAVLTSGGIKLVTSSGRVIRRLRLPLKRSEGFLEGSTPLWSPDERYLAIAVDNQYGDPGRGFFVRTDGKSVGRRLGARRDLAVEPVSWSPVGHTLLVWIQNKGPYAMAPDGSRRRKLFYLQGVYDWAPDGSRIAFVGEFGNIYTIASTGGRPRLLVRTRLRGNRKARGVSVSWSPTGRELAFSDLGGIYVVRADGGGRPRLTARGADSHVAWSPDGTRIAFAIGRDQIFVMRSSGKGLTRLTHSIWDDSPEWSTDGSRVAFTRGPVGLLDAKAMGVYVMDADGTRQRRLARGYGPRWAPDGQRLVYVDVVASRDPSDVGQLRAGRIIVAGADGMSRQTVAVGTAPAWSPDGTTLAFIRYRFASVRGTFYPNESTLYTVRADGSGLRQLAVGDESGEDIFYRPSWSPDGATIAVSAAHATLIDVGTAEVRQLAGVDGDLAWSPDGTRLAYTSFSELGIVNADGSGLRTLARSESFSYANPAWSPSGDSIGFIGCIDPDNETNCDVYVIDTLGSRAKRLTKTPGVEGALDWSAASP